MTHNSKIGLSGQIGSFPLFTKDGDMQLRVLSRIHFSPTLLLLAGFLVLLWIAGGASRGDVLGQAVVRAGAWAVIAAAVLIGPRPDFKMIRPVLFFMIAASLLPLAQLIPLPPSWRPELLDTGLFLDAQAYPLWRPGTIMPSATFNALASLVVPFAMLILFSQANDRARQDLLTLLVIFVATALLVGLIQFSGVRFRNPFINDFAGNVSSIFANRNHFALLLAIGCVLTPAWVFSNINALRWRGPLALALILLFILTILAIGSRTGLVLVALGMLMAIGLVGKQMKRRMRYAPPWLFSVLIVAGLATVIIFTTLSFVADRVETVDRLLSLAVDEDLRNRARPTLLQMILEYMPFGAGLGSFDASFRLNEPVHLLALQYFNQAHNDYLGIALDAGVPGVVLLVSGVAWWAWATVQVIRANGDDVMLGRLGSAILLLIFVASATDYPARTPTVMAIAVIAAAWLARGSNSCHRSGLPGPTLNV